jgi:4-azaleucine resistance transporter AzlC
MGYLSIGVVFGLMLSSIGYNALWAAFMSVTVYAGSGQYLGVDLLAKLAPLTEVAFLTLVINFRHLVYGLSLLEKFHGMGIRKLYMMASLTDETYALLAGVEAPEGVDEKDFYFSIAILNQIYWVVGSAVGAVAGSLININTEGIDFAMTALFIVIAVEQWQSYPSHIPAILGAVGTLAALLILGAESMLIPALCVIVLGLLLLRPKLDEQFRVKGGAA